MPKFFSVAEELTCSTTDAKKFNHQRLYSVIDSGIIDASLKVLQD